MDRRSFLSWAPRAAGATCLIAWAPACERDPKKPEAQAPPDPEAPEPEPAEPAQLLDEAQAAAAGAALARMFPADPSTGAPGAPELGLLGYLDAQLQTPDFQGLERMMLTGFDFLNRLARRRHKTSGFVALSSEQQDAILEELSRGAIEGLRFPQARFFATLHTFGLEGYWGAPHHGGNRDKLAWKWVDIDPHCPHIHGDSCSAP